MGFCPSGLLSQLAFVCSPVLAPLKPKTESCSFTFFLIGLLEERSSIESFYLFNLYRCYGNKNGRQNMLKIEK